MKFLAFLLLVPCAFGCEQRGASSRMDDSTRSMPDSVGGEASAARVDPSLRGVIVVLGSSTAAGTGPKDPRHAWVARYRAYLAARFPNVTLINLAVGGYTTFEVQPSGYLAPANRPTPVAGKNITAALALKPSAIIVNLPSNDQANRYPLDEQLANYARIATLTDAAHVPLWVSTTQPRNFNDSTQLHELMQVRALIAQKFAPRSLDFWTPFAAPDGRINPRYNAGDGTHLNDAAHAILAHVVEAAEIPEHFATAR